MSRFFPLTISYLRTTQLERQPAEWRGGELACVTFGQDSPRDALGDTLIVRVNTPMVGEDEGVLETWRAAQPVSSGQWGMVAYRHNGDLLFGHVALSENDFSEEAADAAGATPLQRATKRAFQEIFGLLDKLNYPYLLRVWNYFPAINEESHGLERYRQFNIGRQEGFAACGRSLTEDIPAACALGTAGGPLTIYFIAGPARPVAIENPRQVSAYYYPPDYGPRSPTFSRASLGRLGEQEVLFISGTASIVGHRSMHSGDVAAQMRETLVNIEAVVGEANRVVARPQYDMGSMSYKVYLRRVQDAGVIRNELQRALGSEVHAIYLQADICRQDLLVEIEAMAGLPLEAP